MEKINKEQGNILLTLQRTKGLNQQSQKKEYHCELLQEF